MAGRSLLIQGSEIAARLAGIVAEGACEVLWPTRCALCDRPGEVLCERCASSLEPIDYWQACPRCGAPFGRQICTECNPVALKRMGRSELPFLGCRSATLFNEESGTVVRTYKDLGERRLAISMAAMIARTVPPEWPIDAVTYIPASIKAIRKRDFDHGALLAQEVARQLQKPLASTLKNPKTADQRNLTRAERTKNLQNSFQVAPQHGRLCALAPRLLLIDDVYTTGATLCSATDALLTAGFKEVRCATFARVY